MARTELDRSRIYRGTGQRVARLIHLYKARMRNPQRDIVDWLGRTIPGNGVIVDIGAQFGNFTQAFPGCTAPVAASTP